ncbi:MAG TPA: HNH endonuclease signature motif containing protein [Thermoanaerobaculia bacterium]|nr:HNH endonuclease signature motif containing protein [Thermoanaerobaculia bacterium]
MSTAIPPALRRLVLARAAGRCEYCGLSQAGQEATFHIDHVLPVKEQGTTNADNLALACVSCSLRKAARLTAIDPETRQEVRLFNPRFDSWAESFRWQGPRLLGLTPVGRATVAALDMNRPLIVAIRQEETALGRHPPG